MPFPISKLLPATFLPVAILLGACTTIETSSGPELFRGVTYHEAWIPGDQPARAHIVHLRLDSPGIRFAVTPADTSKGMEYVARLTTAYLHERHAQVAINASYFLPFKGGSKGGDDYYPHVGEPVNASGAVVAGGKTVSPVETNLDERVDAMLCFRREEARIVDGQRCPNGFSDGVAAGPRLLHDGKPVPTRLQYGIKPQPRTAFALSNDGRSAWIVTVDGRQPDSAGASLPALAAYLAGLGASEAINLDGGGSTTLAVEGKDGNPRVLNRAIHTGVIGRERPVANHVLVFARPARAAR